MGNAIEVGQFYAPVTQLEGRLGYISRLEVTGAPPMLSSVRVRAVDVDDTPAWQERYVARDTLETCYRPMLSRDEAHAEALRENDEHRTAPVAPDVDDAEDAARLALQLDPHMLSRATLETLTDYQSVMANYAVCIVIGCRTHTARLHLCPAHLRSTMAGE